VFRKNQEQIARGIVPERHLHAARYVPRKRVLEMGFADETPALAFAQAKAFVIGAELLA